MDDPPEAAPVTTTAPTGTAGPDGSTPDGTAAPGDSTVETDPADDGLDDDHRRRSPSSRSVRSTRSTAPTGPVEITFWHGLANELEASLIALTDAYNASQDRVRVDLQNQTSYDSVIDKYIQSSQDSRPTVVQFPEYTLQSFAESDTLIPIEACLEASGYDIVDVPAADASTPTRSRASSGRCRSTSATRSSTTTATCSRPPVSIPTVSPITLDELRATSQTIVDSGAASYGWVVDTGPDSGGGWFLEQWFGRAGELYADNGNGRHRPATEVLYDGPTGVELLTFVQSMINDGLAVNVGGNPGGQDGFLKMIDPAAPGAMTIGTSAALGSVIAALGGGIAPGLTPGRHRRRADAGAERHAGRTGRRRVVVDRGRQGRRADVRGLGLHHVSGQRPDPVDVGVGDRVRAGAQRRRRTRSAAHDLHDRSSLRGAVRPAAHERRG